MTDLTGDRQPVYHSALRCSLLILLKEKKTKKNYNAGMAPLPFGGLVSSIIAVTARRNQKTTNLARDTL
jgi:hypothetical protein